MASVTSNTPGGGSVQDPDDVDVELERELDEADAAAAAEVEAVQADDVRNDDDAALAEMEADLAGAGGNGDDGTADGDESGRKKMPAGTSRLALGALGVVFGDIGTSPLYSVREAIHHQHLDVSRTNALGIASIAFWVLILVITIKYLAFVMKADNHGEGGILALTALVMPEAGRRRTATILVMLGVFGTALLYGDGLITPSISVLSAVEGFEIASGALRPIIVPLTCVILVGLFAIQKRGTGAIGKVFGPIMVLWFGTLGVLGTAQVLKHPSVLEAINPIHIVHFFTGSPLKAFLSLGSIFLVVTGGEALYADMGHFGRKPIAVAWYCVVLPALLMTYLGQAAVLITNPKAIENPFYRMAPDWGILPLAVLATMASVIASQALISGAFSLTAQAVRLDYLPRLDIRHTSKDQHGQIYVPLVNWALMIGCVGLVLVFRTSSNLAAAYGLAVTSVMLITTLLIGAVARHLWNWSLFKTTVIIVPFAIIDAAFLAANIPKIPAGGWFSLVIAFGLVIQMTTWRKGRQIVAERIERGHKPVVEVIKEAGETTRVPGVAVFLFKDPGMAPPALVNNLRHNHVLHQATLMVSIDTADSPRVPDAQRVSVSELVEGVHQVRLRYGFMEKVDVPAALAGVKIGDHVIDPDEISYFIGRESVVASKLPGMHPWREHLFVLLNRGAASASRFFKLPTERVFEVGSFVEI